ncbi:flagellar motor switch protein FliM [Pseudomonas aeruginosa]
MTDLLSQDEIDALLRGSDADEDFDLAVDGADNRPPVVEDYDPALQHQVIKDRLHGLDMINAKFARAFRVELSRLTGRHVDVTVKSKELIPYKTFSGKIPIPANLNQLQIKPITNKPGAKQVRGMALAIFSPDFLFRLVDILFGGKGRSVPKSDGRDFTPAEQRFIVQLVSKLTPCYETAWKGIEDIEIKHTGSEMQARFANLTSSPQEIVVNTEFRIEMGDITSDFHIAFPYAMVKEISKKLSGPTSDVNSAQEKAWNAQMANEVKNASVTIKANFVEIHTTFGAVLDMVPNQTIFEIEQPDEIIATVDGIPLFDCTYGQVEGGGKALQVNRVREHNLAMMAEDS